jgi:hypothetical protein
VPATWRLDRCIGRATWDERQCAAPLDKQIDRALEALRSTPARAADCKAAMGALLGLMDQLSGLK